MKHRNLVKFHKLHETKGDRNSYITWNDSHSINRQKDSLGGKFDFITEDVRANPDSLQEDEAMYANGQPSTPHFLMGEAINHLQGRQKEVYLLTMREGKSLAEAAQVLGIAKGTAQKFRERAVKFLTAYCKQAIAGGRV